MISSCSNSFRATTKVIENILSVLLCNGIQHVRKIDGIPFLNVNSLEIRLGFLASIKIMLVTCRTVHPVA
ncbi:Oxidoreductase AflY [Frankliniella fusca]|uniref:Oxidoreductase AflY n=1 Tax=Frankliniella fusca TaxID=407009 RepID=A0AAE1GR60_9NEOP|nr:Oxidoreductase AflY [Frankliniella fusca]KAK3915777.1 Oxidoreductase AflY [Frankliniella fusca]KAK3917013.1 Oxidoreductase AflY [Frankliniella fusca]KAK3924120.1 Oxidoreductase AflY [Frankliniella fusca]